MTLCWNKLRQWISNEFQKTFDLSEQVRDTLVEEEKKVVELAAAKADEEAAQKEADENAEGKKAAEEAKTLSLKNTEGTSNTSNDKLFPLLMKNLEDVKIEHRQVKKRLDNQDALNATIQEMLSKLLEKIFPLANP